MIWLTSQLRRKQQGSPGTLRVVRLGLTSYYCPSQSSSIANNSQVERKDRE